CLSPCILAAAGTLLNVQQTCNFTVAKTFHRLKVDSRPVSDRQHSDALHHLFCLDNRRYRILSYLEPVCVDYIDAFIDILVLLQNIDTSMNNNTPDPSFKSTTVLKRMHLQKDFNKAFLKHVFCIFAVMCIPIANGQHF